MKRIEALKSMVSDNKLPMQIVIGGLVLDAKEVVAAHEYLEENIPEKQEPKKVNITTVSAPKFERKNLDDGKMLALRKAGWTYDKIADEMGCSTQTVINHIREKE